MDAAVRANGTCVRCNQTFGSGPKCQECGVGRSRTVRVIRRNTKATGKRGRNSGKVSQHGKKN